MAHCKVQGLSAVSCAQMAELIEMLKFGLWTWVGPRHHAGVIDGVQIPVHKGTILRVKMGRAGTCQDMSNS